MAPKFKPFHARCPSCRKHIYIMSEDQKIVECANCGDKWNITFTIRKKVKLSKITSESNSNGGHSEWQ